MNNTAWAVISVLGIIFGFVVGVAVGNKTSDNEYQRELDRRTYAKEEVERELEEERKKRTSEKAEYQKIIDTYQEAEKIRKDSEYDPDDGFDIPYEIHEDQLDDFPGSDSTTLTYYVGDAVYADEDNHKIDHPEDILGEETISITDDFTEDDFLPLIFIRNPVQNMIYEIVVENELSYERDVLGIHDSDDDDD